MNSRPLSLLSIACLAVALIILPHRAAWADDCGGGGNSLGNIGGGSGAGALLIIPILLLSTTVYSSLCLSTKASSSSSEKKQEKQEKPSAEEQILSFVGPNRDAFEIDVVRGGGDTIWAISDMAGCRDPAAVGVFLQGRYHQLFKGSQDVGSAIIDLLRTHASLGCTQLGR